MHKWNVARTNKFNSFPTVTSIYHMTQISVRSRVTYRRSQFHNVYWLLWKMHECVCVYVCTDKTLNSNQAVETISLEFQWNSVKNSSHFNYFVQKALLVLEN